MTNPDEKKIPTFCSLCGPTMGCGIYCYVKDGRLVRVEGMKESPRNRGKLCPRAFASVQWLYSPQRLKYPLKRIGKKGEGKFEKIGWDEALDIIAAKLLEQKEKYGPESLAILSPARRSYSDYLFRFLVVHGSPNYGHSGICAVQRAFGFAYTLGVSMLAPDYNNADLIIIWGGNPVYSGTPQGGLERILNAKERDAKLIVIKPQMPPRQTFGCLSDRVQTVLSPWQCLMLSSMRICMTGDSWISGATASTNSCRTYRTIHRNGERR